MTVIMKQQTAEKYDKHVDSWNLFAFIWYFFMVVAFIVLQQYFLQKNLEMHCF